MGVLLAHVIWAYIYACSVAEPMLTSGPQAVCHRIRLKTSLEQSLVASGLLHDFAETNYVPVMGDLID